MMWGTGVGGVGLWDWVLMTVMMTFGVMVLVGLVLLIVWAVRSMSSGSSSTESGSALRGSGRDPALDIARQRLARGEIDTEEYARIRDALGG